MRVRILGCSGGSAPGRCLSGYLVDDVLAVDAGALTTGLSLEEQERVEAVLLTHAHLDHVWSFPLYLANRFSLAPRPTTVWGSPAALAAVRRSLFDDAVWPDLDKFVVDDVPLARFQTIEDGAEAEVLDGYLAHAVPVTHTVPTQAFFVTHDGACVLFCGDSGPTEAIWEVANAREDLRAVVIECSFADHQEELAAMTGHLVPRTLKAEIDRLAPDVPVLVTHIKPEARELVLEQVAALGDDRIAVLHDGQVLELA